MRPGLRPLVAAIVLVGGVGECASTAPEPWDDATRILWADPMKDPLPGGGYRDIRVRAQLQGRDWAQWVPSRRADPLTHEEIARALDQGYLTTDVHAQEVLLRRPGIARVEISTLEPPVITERGTPWREPSAWSEPRSYGVPLVSSPDPILTPEPGRGELMAAGLLMLTFLHQRRRRGAS